MQQISPLYVPVVHTKNIDLVGRRAKTVFPSISISDLTVLCVSLSCSIGNFTRKLFLLIKSELVFLSYNVIGILAQSCTTGHTYIRSIYMCVDVLAVFLRLPLSTYHNDDLLQMYQLVQLLNESARKWMFLKLAKD